MHFPMTFPLSTDFLMQKGVHSTQTLVRIYNVFVYYFIPNAAKVFSLLGLGSPARALLGYIVGCGGASQLGFMS